MRLIGILIVTMLACLPVRAQKEVPYYEAISSDSVRLYLESMSMFGSSRTCFTGKDCAMGFRCTRISSDGYFDGLFKDFMAVGRVFTMTAQGNYVEGRKEGRFIFYHQNGRPMTEGQFKEDEPVGQWNYYSADGTLLMTLTFDGGPSPRIEYMFDDKARLVLVKNGNGEARFVSQWETPYVISGRVKSGLPDGEWIGEVTETVGNAQVKWVRKELYREGKMIGGKKYQSGRVTDVCCTPELAWIFPTPAVDELIYLEQFPIERCPDQVQIISTEELAPPRSAEPVTDLYNFESSLRSIIRAKYQWRQVGEGYNPTVPGNEENRVVMQFDTNEKGRPVKIRLVSAFGRDFYQPIKRSLETLTKWHPNQTKLVLTVYIRMGVSTYSYRYNFSLD
jgi:antitoxin component YwqK of YwqJK toxin-antitoxin module